jgi:hypothetical protein
MEKMSPQQGDVRELWRISARWGWSLGSLVERGFARMVYPGFQFYASRSRPEVSRAVLFALLVTLFAILSHPAHPVSRWAWAGASADARPQAHDSSDAVASSPVSHGSGPQAGAPDPRHRIIAEYLARRFQVAAGPTAELVEDAFRVGARSGVDPLLILSVIAIESRFHPFAESPAGAKGLMQIIPKYHLDKLKPLGGEEAVLDPEVNLRVGAEILQEYFKRSGNLRDALQMYNGSLGDETYGYASKVLREKNRLHQVVVAQAEA